MKYINDAKFNLGILCWLTLIFKALGQKTDIIDCTNNELVTSIFNDPIDLTLRGIIKIYENVTINRILSTTNNEFELNYIDARLEGINEKQNLILFTTEHFENYAKTQTATRISLKINLGCGMGKERVVIFFQPLKEGNYFSPIFSKTFYEFIIPTPIFAGFDLTAFLEITARDDDLTHNQIVFTSNDSLKNFIRVGTKNITSADKKIYFANLTLERILLNLPQAIEFEIVATDNGNPPKNATSLVIVRSDPNRSLPSRPKFTRRLYKGYINLDLQMEPIELQVFNGTYAPEVEFSLNGVDAQDFILQDNKNGSIEIIWYPKNLNRSEILKRRIWELEVKAQHKSLAEMESSNVIIEIADVKSNFHFMSSYYEGSIDELGELHINDIIFNPYIYQPDMKFALQSLHDFFYLSIRNFSIQLQLNDSFSWQAIDDIAYIRLTLQALWESLSATTNIIIKLPPIEEEKHTQMFEFERPLYVGKLTETYDLQLETIVLKTNVSNTQEIEYNLSGNDSDKFDMIKNGNHIELEWIFDQEVKLKNSYLLILEANSSAMKTFASVIINVPMKIKRQAFLMPLVMGNLVIDNITRSQQLNIASISVARDLEEKFNELKFRLAGDHSLYFEIEESPRKHSIDIVLKTALPTNILATRRVLNMTVQAIIPEPDGFNDTLTIFIELPVKECPNFLTHSPDPPQFSSSNYVFTIYTNQTGILGIVNAFSRGRNITLHYVLDIQNDELAQRLSINPFTGELTLYGTIEEGNYLFNITAENIETHERTVARALLKVQQKEECTLFEGVAVEKTLMIIHVDEEKPNYGLIDMKLNENCIFHIVDMMPNDKEYVHVNIIFNILDAISIDREDEIFKNISEPQIMIKLKLKCDIRKEKRNLTIDIPKPLEKRASEITFTEDIPYSPDIMWLYLKIDDINDNAPEFVFEGPLYLGYPAGNAALDIFPEYLTQIEAFDRDIGYNAAIVYAIKDNSYFDIEPKTGKIYPKGKALIKNQQTELIVMAIDQNGEGLISRTVVLVKGLSSDFYSLITLKENSPKTKQEMEKQLSLETGLNINILKMSYMPQELPQRSSENQNFSCKAWIYAYDKHKLVTHKAMQEQLLIKSPQPYIINIESYEEGAARTSPSHDNINLNCLIPIILLSLISCSFLIFIIWRFCYKATLTAKCDTKPQSFAAAHNGNGKHISAECSHGFHNEKDCTECKNHDNNHVKFNDLAENEIVGESQLK